MFDEILNYIELLIRISLTGTLVLWYSGTSIFSYYCDNCKYSIEYPRRARGPAIIYIESVNFF